MLDNPYEERLRKLPRRPKDVVVREKKYALSQINLAVTLGQLDPFKGAQYISQINAAYDHYIPEEPEWPREPRRR